MTVEVAQAYVTLLPSARGFGSKVEKLLNNDLKRAGKRGGDDYADGMEKGIKGSKGKLAGAMKGLGAAMAGAVGFVAITAGIKEITSAASDAEQSVGGVAAIFKDSAAAVEAAAAGAATAYGLSATDYRTSANLIGSLLKNQGTATEELAPKTENLIGLASDLAATYGGTVTEAVEAISSALKGEMDPLEKYGISLNDAAIKGEQAALGIEDLAKSNGILAKSMAVQSLLSKQSADAQGGFARETDTLAHQQQVAAATIENLSANLGQLFLPYMTDAAKSLNENVLPALSQFIDDLKSGTGWAGEIGNAVKTGFEWFATGKEYAVQFGQQVLPTFERIANIVRTQVIPIFTDLWNKVRPVLEGFATKAMALWSESLQPAIASIWDAIQTKLIPAWLGVAYKILPVLQDFGNYVGRLWTEFIGPAFSRIVEFVQTKLVPAFLYVFNEVAVPAYQAFAAILGAVWENVIGPVFNTLATVILDVVAPALLKIWDTAQPVLDNLGKFLRGLWEGILRPVFMWLADVIVNVVLPGFKKLWDGISSVLLGIGKAFLWVWDNILGPFVTMLSDVIGGLPEFFGKAVDGIGKAWETITDALKAPFIAVWEFMKDKFFGPLNDALESVGLGQYAIKLPGLDQSAVDAARPPASQWAPPPIPGVDPVDPSLYKSGDSNSITIEGVDMDNAPEVADELLFALKQLEAQRG